LITVFADDVIIGFRPLIMYREIRYNITGNPDGIFTAGYSSISPFVNAAEIE